jgi:NAD(P)-dependent dehydrogenase (short-subunit alcohol dehydrogenase family)
MPEPDLVVITGCTRGLGRAMASGFAALGWTVAGCGTRPAAVAALQEELGATHMILGCDVAEARQVEDFAGRVVDALGPPRLLVNNAALINACAPLWEVPEDEFSRLVDVNLKGVHLVCRAFLPAMIEAGRGVIANISSGWGRSTSPEVAPYCATKWGIEGLTGALAQELPRGLAAVAVNPGIIDTDMLRSCFGAGAESYPDAAEWAASAVPFLAALEAADNGRPVTVPGA